MKISAILILVQFFISANCTAQNEYKVLDSLESSFERIKHDMSIPCQFEVKFNKRENGNPFFIAKDSFQLEFDFFKISSVPFYNSNQTNFETTSAYYDWVLQRKDAIKNIKIDKVDESKEYGYFVYKVQDNSGKFYRLLAREGDILFSIKIFDNNMSMKDQLDKLQILYSLNKK